MAKGKLRVATCQFSEAFQPRRNAAIVRRYIVAAARRRCDVVHFHECCLSGYGPPVGTAQYDWDALHEATESVMAEAKRCGTWVVLGSSHRLTGRRKPHNSLYLISPDGKIIDRYDKRFCTGGDLETYSPGDHFVTFRLNGIRCSLLICYDLRFPEVYRELYKLGVKVIFQSFHNGGQKGPSVHEHIMRQTVQAHAGINAMWISANNSSKFYSAWPSVFITPDGKIEGMLKRNRAGMMVNAIDVADTFYDAGAAFRDRAIRGILHSGTLVSSDPRSTDRKCL